MAYRWRWVILIVWGAALLLSLPVLPRVAGALKVGGFSSSNTEAAHARVPELIAEWTREHPALAHRGVRSRIAARLHRERTRTA